MDVRRAVFFVSAVFVTAAAAIAIAENAGTHQAAAAPPRHRTIHHGSSPYVLDGCPVYTAHDWLTTNLLIGGSPYVSNTADRNSPKIIAHFSAAFGDPVFSINGTNASVSGNAVVNQATNATPLHTIQGLSWGFFNDPHNDDPKKQIPWTNGFLNGSADHAIVLNTQTCVDYEVYDAHWNGSSFAATDGYVHNLNDSFESQYRIDGGTMTKSGIPLIGTMDVGEDAAMPTINHIAYLLIPGMDGSSIAAGGYVAPATAGAPCVARCSNALPFGARLRLNSSKYTCPATSTNPQAHKICVQLETYGAIVMDHNGCPASCSGAQLYSTRLSATSSGGNPWNEDDVSALNGIPLSDWDVMSLGDVH